MILRPNLLKNTWVRAAAALSVFAGLVALPQSAMAQGVNNPTVINSTFFADVTADPGTFSPVTLGDSISLNACSSRVTLVGGNKPFGRSICEINNPNLYSVNWFATNVTTGAFTWLTGGFGTDDNLDLSLVPDGSATTNSVTSTATGAGTFFNSVGTYAIGILFATQQDANNVTNETVTANNSTYFNLNIRFSSDNASNLTQAFSANGNLNQHAAYGANFVVSAPPVAVPEPEAVLLLIPAIVAIARRQRRRKQSLKV